jgi:hypothetical protein
MARNPTRIHSFCFDSVQAHADAGGIEANLPDQTGFGYHFDHRLSRLCDGQLDEIRLLLGHPVPVLSQVARLVRPPRESCAAVAEETKCDFCPDVDGDDVWYFDFGAFGNA